MQPGSSQSYKGTQASRRLISSCSFDELCLRGGITRFFLLASLIFLGSCDEEKPKNNNELTKDQMTDLSVQMNSWDADRQQDEIDQYIRRHGWEMEQTKSGVYFMTVKEGSGDSAKTGQTAKVIYDIYLLDGTKCYSSDSTGAKEFAIGEDYVESGLHEGILLMQVGDHMRFILPSHLAHGLTGDQEKIPPRSSVVYEVQLLGLR